MPVSELKTYGAAAEVVDGRGRLGTAFAVSGKLLVSAHHVVDGLKVQELRVQFATAGKPLIRRVSRVQRMDGTDIVLIRLRAKLPPKHRTSKLAGSITVGDRWIAPGFPLDGGQVVQVITGFLAAPLAKETGGLLQLQCDQTPDKILRGFSGAPVFAIHQDQLDPSDAVGVILESPAHPDGSDAAYGGVVLAFPTAELHRWISEFMEATMPHERTADGLRRRVQFEDHPSGDLVPCSRDAMPLPDMMNHSITISLDVGGPLSSDKLNILLELRVSRFATDGGVDTNVSQLRTRALRSGYKTPSDAR